MMEFTIPTFVWTIINFLLLLGILSFFLFKPVNEIINKRNESITNNIKKAEEDRQVAEKLKIENEKEYKLAKQQGKNIVKEYKQKAEKVSQEIISDAHKEAELILERAKKEIEREREKAEYEMKMKTVDLAIELSKKALEESIDEAKHRELIRDFIAKVGN
ncbi:ATP synthase subunit b, sodium ion specific [Clostridium colicanis DSM 13634]|uniref:ATP synthase subunit b n=2 Tax=Clostridium TaxID=1485 RepID=A0A151AP24_9CLOT|nr:ATP synthase subunit b, sodium ion specific [Clostridium colicanis DSM 13634]